MVAWAADSPASACRLGRRVRRQAGGNGRTHVKPVRRQLKIERLQSLTTRGPLMASCHQLRHAAGLACHNQPCLPWQGFAHNRYEAFAAAAHSAERNHLQPQTARISLQGIEVLQSAWMPHRDTIKTHSRHSSLEWRTLCCIHCKAACCRWTGNPWGRAGLHFP